MRIRCAQHEENNSCVTIFVERALFEPYLSGITLSETLSLIVLLRPLHWLTHRHEFFGGGGVNAHGRIENGFSGAGFYCDG